MAYTYDDFVAAATGAGLLEKFNDDDLNIAKTNPEFGISALKLQQELASAKTTEQQLLAQEAINQLRTSYGNLNKQAGSSFSYGNQAAYDEALDKVVNHGSFNYDPTADESYGALKKTYLREGERARENTLAKVSAATGGAPSSYAVTAAQQAGDYYNTRFADLVPTLEQNAYQKYLDAFSADLSKLGALEADRSTAWSEYLKNYELQQAAYNRLMALMTGYHYEPTEEELKAAGMTVAQKNAIMKPYYDALAAAAYEENSSGGGGGTYNYDTHGFTNAEIRELQKQAGIAVDGVWGPDTQQAFENAMNELGNAPAEHPGYAAREEAQQIERKIKR